MLNAKIPAACRLRKLLSLRLAIVFFTLRHNHYNIGVANLFIGTGVLLC